MRMLFPAAAVMLLSGCLLFIPPPDIQPIEDQVLDVGEELSLELSALDPKSREVSFTYEVDGGGWIDITGNTLKHTFHAQGQYTVTIYASNGIRQSETSFTVTVE